MKTLIIGQGEVGKALWEILTKFYDCQAIDKEYSYPLFDYVRPPEIIHICFPYTKDFIKEVKRYQVEFEPKYTVIHSTVPVGTSRQCNAIHSPVKGMHPFLRESLKTFTKFLGGKEASEVADYFRHAGMKVYLCRRPETTELMKLLSTAFYGLCIEYVKDIEKQCQKYKVPFSEVYTLWTEDYNRGYEELGYPEYKRPLLIPIQKKQGGHCILPNCELINTVFTQLVKKLNAKPR